MSERPDLLAGDRVEIGTTSEFKVDGFSTWVKVGVNVAVQDGESADEAVKRASKVVARNLVREIERHGENLAAANAAQKR